MSDTPNGIIPVKLERWFCRSLERVTKSIAATGLSPNQVTIISLFFGMLTGLSLIQGKFGWALLFGFLMAVADVLDGQLAVLTNQKSRFGGILDSTIDRYNEALLFIGLGGHFYLTGQPVWIFIIALIMIGSFNISYVKARAEGAGMDCPVGLLQRSERLVMIAIGIIFQGWVLNLILILLAIMTQVTVIQRLLYVAKTDKSQGAPTELTGKEKYKVL